MLWLTTSKQATKTRNQIQGETNSFKLAALPLLSAYGHHVSSENRSGVHAPAVPDAFSCPSRQLWKPAVCPWKLSVPVGLGVAGPVFPDRTLDSFRQGQPGVTSSPTTLFKATSRSTLCVILPTHSWLCCMAPPGRHSGALSCLLLALDPASKKENDRKAGLRTTPVPVISSAAMCSVLGP